MDTISSKVCGRCGGSGQYSYNPMDGTICYGCGGTGRVAMTPKGQKKIKPTADFKDAVPGDVVKVSKVLYRVERVTWSNAKRSGWFVYNQYVHCTRLVDGKTIYIRRECMGEVAESCVIWHNKNGMQMGFGMNAYTPKPEEIGQETTVTFKYLTIEEEQQAISGFFAKHTQYNRDEITIRPRPE